MKKVAIDSTLEGKALEVAQSINSMVDEIEQKNSTIADLKSQIEAIEAKGYDGYRSEIDTLKGIVADLEEKSSKGGSEKNMGIAEAVKAFFVEKGITSVEKAKPFAGQEFELKADNPISNTSYTGNYSRTQAVADVRFPAERPKAFLDKGIRVGIIENGKNILLWTTGSFTEVVGYAGELDDITTGGTEVAGSSAAATDKTRKTAKIAARMILSEEVFEDLGQFGQRAEQKLVEKVDLWLDQKIWDGDGNDSTATGHIYGAKTQGITAFDSANANKVAKPNESDLVDACATQAEESYFKTNTVWMSAKLANKLRRTKDVNGQYIVNQLIDGTEVMGGHRVIRTPLMQNGSTQSMLVGDASLIQLWMKRNVSTEIIRNAKKDCYEMYLYARCQELVEDEDKKGLIYVADVAAALTAITPA